MIKDNYILNKEKVMQVVESKERKELKHRIELFEAHRKLIEYRYARYKI